MEGTEIEGEARCYKENEDGTRIDPDNDFSYLDAKIKNVLGHFRKDFEGGVSVENLGAKFGGYGSFLPTHQCSPSIWSHSKSSQPFPNHCESSSLDNQSAEVASQDYTAPPSSLPRGGSGAASCNSHFFDSSRLPSGEVQAKQDSCSKSCHVAEQLPLKHESLNRPTNPSGERTLKFRIKVGSTTISQKKAVIYSGLGLDISPSSSLEDSLVETGDSPVQLRRTLNESPTGILEVMTSFPVPGDIFLSPLNDRFLSMTTNEAPGGSSKPAVNLRVTQRHTASSVDESACELSDEKFQKEKKVKVKGNRRAGLKIENDMSFLAKEKVDNGTPDGKEGLSNNVKLEPLSKSTCYGKYSMNGTILAHKAHKRIGGEMSSDSAKKDSFELMSAQDSSNNEKQKFGSHSLGIALDSKASDSHNYDSVNMREDDRTKTDNISIRSKANASESKEVPNVRVKHPSEQKIVKKTASSMQDEVKMPGETEKSLSESNRRPKKILKKHRLASNLIEENLRDGFPEALKDGKHINHNHACKGKMHNLKCEKDIHKVRDKQRDSLGDTISKGIVKETVLLQKPSGDVQKNSDHKAAVKEHREPDREPAAKEEKALFNKSKERLHCNKGGKKSALEGTVQDSPNCITQFVGDILAPEATQETGSDYWVCCDSCNKWILLPIGRKPEHLPEKWSCSMIDWLPGMNRCDISAEETNALTAFPFPVPGTENNMYNHTNGTTLGGTSANMQQLDEGCQDINMHAMHNSRRKKLGSKGMPKRHQEETVNCRSLYDVNQGHSESKLMKANSQLSKMTLAKEKHLHKNKMKQINGGAAKQTGANNKREADQSVYGASKKTKMERVNHIDKFLSSEHDVDLVKTAGRDMQHHDEYLYSKDAMGKLVRKKQRDHGYVSLDGHMETCKREITPKKRKFKDSLEDHNCVDMVPSAGRHILDAKVSVKEEGNKNLITKEMKLQVGKERINESSRSKGGARSNKKCRVSRMSSSGGADDPVVGLEQVKNIKDKLLTKHGKIFPQRTLNGVDSLKRDLGYREASAVVTSSSSVVSGSRKSNVSFQEGKGSPVESVSSTPFRTSAMNRSTPARKEISEKVDAVARGIPQTCSPKRCSDIEHNGESNQLVAVRKQKSSFVLHTESPELPEKLDFQDTDANKKFSGTTKLDVNCPSENENSHLAKGDALNSKNYVRDSFDLHPLGHGHNEDKFSDHCKVNNNKDVINLFTEKNFLQNSSNVDTREIQSNLEEDDGLDVKQSAMHTEDNANRRVNVETGKFPNPFFGKSDFMQREAGDIRSRIVSRPGVKQEILVQGSQSVLRLQKGGILDAVSANASGNGDHSSLSKQYGYANNETGGYFCLGHLLSGGVEVSDERAPSPLRIDTFALTADDALKKAKDLLDYAAYLKNSGSAFESNEVHFQCGLQYLHCASLLETSNNEDDKQGEMTQIQMYKRTAEICISCAHEYERHQEMAAAALAYKCVEVAYMRIIYCKNSSTSEYQQEIQAAPQMLPHGESPLSSASDVDNLNNQSEVGKAAVSKDTGSHVAGSHVIIARNRPNFIRLLDFVQQVNYAMEASRKSQSAFAAANEILESSLNREDFNSVRKVFDFSFQDVGLLVSLVWLAKGIISRSCSSGSKG